MWAGLICAKFGVACLQTMATFKKGKLTRIIFPLQEFGNTAHVTQLFQAAWFQLLQVTLLAAVIVQVGRSKDSSIYHSMILE